MENSPDWLDDTTSSEVRAARVRVQELVTTGQTLFRKLLVPQSIERSDGLEKLMNRFDEPTMNAIITLFFELNRALFEKPETYFSFGETSRKYMIEAIGDDRVIEFGQFTGQIFDPNDKLFPGEIVEITDFYKAWLNETKTSVRITFIIDPSPSETAARRRWSDELSLIARHFDENLEAGKAADVAVQAAQRATRAANHAQMAAGDTAQFALGDHFNKIANRERRWALGWTIFTILGVVAVALLGLQIISAAVIQDWLKTVFHLVLVLPILALASYTATIAKSHRILERWATTAYVQIRTVGAYSDLLPNGGSSREDLIMDLGRNIFGTPALGEDPKSERISSVPADLLEALKEIAKALAARTGSRE